MNLQPLDGFWARIALVLMVLTTACEHIPTGNKWDPKTPAEQQAKGTLRGRVELLQFAGKEANQTINVELHESGDSPSEATDNQRPDADGRFAFQVSPGTYEVVATAPGYMTATRSASLGIGADLDLGSIGLQHESQGPDSVPFAARLTLAGEAESGGTTVRLRLAGRDAPFAVAVTDADGRIEVPASRAERYRLLIDRTSWRLPAPDTIYAWYPVDTEDRGGHFSPEGGDGAPIDIELLPSEAAVCGDGEIEACVEPFGACVGGTRVCVNGKWSPCATQSEERCDGIDNDCDGTVDDDLRGDRACALPNAAATCEDGRCVVVRCLGAYLDPDGSAANGCECAPTGAEGSDCNGLDDDCNGQIDENVNKLSDPRHCGDACVVCAFPNGRADCVEGRCVLAGCQDGFHDFDGQPLNGCEAACVVTNGGVEACDYVDNNCDGQVDENFQPLDENVAHCGACENDCRRFANGAFGCSAGTCVLLSCEPGHVDLDREVATGCEYACNQTHGGIEACDAVDNDCDGRTDEDFDLRNDPENCGRCGEVCTTPNAQRACVDGRCRIAQCDPGWVDANLSPEDGCEAPCVGSTELCNGVDDDCDGEVDESYPEVGQPCSTGLGACRSPGVYVCLPDGSTSRCGAVAGVPTDESCNGVDDDCDGTVDDGFDVDFDGFTSCGGDCDDSDPEVNPNAVEVCNGIDDDCNGRSDEGFDLLVDLDNCGRCGRSCVAPNADSECALGACRITACGAGLYDADTLYADGCEYACRPSLPAVERCNGRDDDCDGEVDEGLPLGAVCDGAGQCGRGVFECFAGGGVGCSTDPGGSGYDGNPEACNELDDDCDGLVDEDFDLQSSLENCGACGDTCAIPNADYQCVGGLCTKTACLPGFFDFDPRAPGCEYACRPTVPPDEICDGRDNNCDGQVDEGYDTGNVCVGEGRCGVGTRECSADGSRTLCSTERGGTNDQSAPEQCNAQDDDCDGATDEDVSADLLASDPRNCGACDHICPVAPNAVSVCRDGGCDIRCVQGYVDGNGFSADGCEVSCAGRPTIALEDPTVAQINAAIAQAGPCGTVEILGSAPIVAHAVAEDDGIVIDQAGLTLRRRIGATNLLSGIPSAPMIDIRANDVVVSNFETAPSMRDVTWVRARTVRRPTIEDVTVTGSSLSCGDNLPEVSALIFLDDTQDAQVRRLRFTDTAIVIDGGGAMPRCAGRTGALVDVRGSQAPILDSLDIDDGYLWAPLPPAAVALRYCQDAVVRNSTFRIETAEMFAPNGGDGASGHGIRVENSDRTTVSRCRFLERGMARYVGVYLDGKQNRVEDSEFGAPSDGSRHPCLYQAVEMADPYQSTVSGSRYHGVPFGVVSQAGAQSLESTTWHYPRPPTNFGAWVFAGGTGVRIRDNDVSAGGDTEACFVDNRYSGQMSLADTAGLVSILGATDVLVEGNRFDMRDLWPASACPLAGLALTNVRRGVIRDNLVAPVDGRCTTAHGFFAEDGLGTGIFVNRGADVFLGPMALIPGAAPAGGGTYQGFHFTLSEVTDAVVEGVDVRSLDAIRSAGLRVSNSRVTTLQTEGCVSPVIEGLVAETLSSNEDSAPQLVSSRISGQVSVTNGQDAALIDLDVGPSPCAGPEFGRYPAAATVRMANAIVSGGRYCGPTGLTFPLADGPATLENVVVEASQIGIETDRVPIVGRNLTIRGIPAGRPTAIWGPPPFALSVDLRNSVLDGVSWRNGGVVPTGHIGLTYTALNDLSDATPAAVTAGVGTVPLDCDLQADGHLGAGSPCIDLGDPDDPVGDEPAPNGGRVNLGAFGGTALAEPTP